MLTAFAAPADELPLLLGTFAPKDWLALLPWLDASGLALYLLDHLQCAGMQHLLPPAILSRLQQNMRDNTDRNEALLAETANISHALEQEGVPLATLKGISLTPESVPNPSLRCQLDLDFLIPAAHADVAARVLERFGYTLHSTSGNTWEFKAGASLVAKVQDLYKPKPQRSAELHLEHSPSLISRCQVRSFSGIALQVLAPSDLFVAQATHLFKHLCGSFTRASWLLEFHRHLLARSADTRFWHNLDLLIADDPQPRLAIAIVSMLSAQVFRTTLPLPIQRLIADQLPASAQLWIESYSLAYLLTTYPGSKLSLLLQAALANGLASPRTELRGTLIPLRLPPMITLGHRNESIVSRLRRLFIQVRFTLSRLRFHAVEGARYCIERPRFRRRLAGLPS